MISITKRSNRSDINSNIKRQKIDQPIQRKADDSKIIELTKSLVHCRRCLNDNCVYLYYY